MRFPNKYGGIVKLGGKRRKPYAVRITAGYKDFIVVPNKQDCYPIIDKYNMSYRKKTNDYCAEASDRLLSDLAKFNVEYRPLSRRQFKYLEYFEKSSDAYAYLAKMNAGEDVQKHVPVASEPSFRDVYEQYIGFITSLKKKPSKTTLDSYKSGFNLWEDVHDIRFKAITTEQLQDAIIEKSEMSRSSVQRMKTILKKIYGYAVIYGICDKDDDKSSYLTAQYSESEENIHTDFSSDEIDLLWAHSDDETAKLILILIYSGMRCGEFLHMEKRNVFVKDRYMIGGSKTQAGINRKIPIHERITPFIEYFYNLSQEEYMYPLSRNGKIKTISHLLETDWKPYLSELGMNHLTHDARHTCATLLEKHEVPLLHRQLILGHRISNITERVYTHVAIEDLIADINKIP